MNVNLKYMEIQVGVNILKQCSNKSYIIPYKMIGKKKSEIKFTYDLIYQKISRCC